MTLQLLHSEFPYIWGKFYFSFISAPTSFHQLLHRIIYCPVLLNLGSFWMTGFCLALGILFGLMYVHYKTSFCCSIFLKCPWGRGLSGHPRSCSKRYERPWGRGQGRKGPLSPRFTPTISMPLEKGVWVDPLPAPLDWKKRPWQREGNCWTVNTPTVWISCHISYAHSLSFYPYLHSPPSSVVFLKWILYVQLYIWW
jgi:hypothetical protein